MYVTSNCAAAQGPAQALHAQQLDLQQRLKAVTRDAAPADGTLSLPGISSDLLQQQFMFAVAVHEKAPKGQRLLLQLRQAKRSLLQAARRGESLYAWQ